MNPQNDGAMAEEKEFSIIDFIRHLWRYRLWVVLAPALAACLAVSVSFFYASIPAPVTLYIELKGIEKGLYANGAKFTPGDLVTPEVVETLRVKYANAFTAEDFARGVTVEYGTLLIRPLVQRYEILMANKQLKPSELEDLSNRLGRELDSLSQRGLRIRILPEELFLNRDQAMQLALDVPNLWNNIFAEKYNIFLDRDVLNMEIAKTKPDLTRLKDVLTVSSLVQTMVRGLSRIKIDPRVQVLRSTSGMTAGELEVMVGNYLTISFQPILSSLMQQANLPGVDLYKKEVRIRMREVETRIAGLDQSISNLFSNRDARALITQSAASGAGNLQLTDGGIDQLLKLGQQNANTQYLQGLLTKRIELTDSRAGLLSEIERLDVVTESDVTPATLKDAEISFSNIAAEYRSLVGQVIARLKQTNKRLYSVVGAPTIEKSGALRFLLITTASAIFMSLFLVLGVLTLTYAMRRS